MTVCCMVCGEIIEVPMTDAQEAELSRPDRRKIQDIFPELSKDLRELLISGTCGKCFNELFEGNEDL